MSKIALICLAAILLCGCESKIRISSEPVSTNAIENDLSGTDLAKRYRSQRATVAYWLKATEIVSNGEEFGIRSFGSSTVYPTFPTLFEAQIGRTNFAMRTAENFAKDPDWTTKLVGTVITNEWKVVK